MKGLSKKKILVIAILSLLSLLSLLFYLLGDGGDDLPGTWLYKIFQEWLTSCWAYPSFGTYLLINGYATGKWKDDNKDILGEDIQLVP